MSNEKKYKDLTKNTVLFGISSFGTKIISFLLVPLYTYALSTSEFGTVDIVNSTVSLLIPLLTLNVQDAILRFGLDKEYTLTEIKNEAIKINFISVLILFALITIVDYFNIITVDKIYWIFILVLFTLGTLLNSITMYLKSLNKVSVIAISGIGNTVIYSFLSIIFIIKYKWGVNGYLLAIVLGNLFSVIYMTVKGKVYKDIQINKKTELTKEMLTYSLPLVVNSVSWWLNSASDKYILTLISGLSVTGIYSVANKIPSILSIIQNIFYNAWSISAITEFDPKDKNGFLGEVYNYYSSLSILGASLIMLLNFWISKLLFTDNFFQAWQYVPFLLVGAVFNGLALFEGAIFAAAKETKSVTKTTVIGALVNILLNFLLIYLIGPIGAALATMIGLITTWFVRTLFLLKLVRIKIQWGVQLPSYLLIIIQSIIATKGNTESLQIIFLIILVFIQRKYLLFYFQVFYKKIKNDNKMERDFDEK